tara:strand:+ start:44 stop:271 length:228 start_codon:yes stop_codon:yes gene_type:complete
MNHFLHKGNTAGQVATSNLPSRPVARRNISYKENEQYIVDIEKKLMKKYRLGASQLHKLLVIKAGQQEINLPVFF